MGNPKAIDRAIAQEAQKQGLQPLPVRQGYSACSVALVDGLILALSEKMGSESAERMIKVQKAKKRYSLRGPL